MHVDLATLYVQKGLIKEAIEESKTALLDDPDHLPAHLLLGGLYCISKDYPSAISSYKRVLQINPQHRESYLFLSSIYEDLQQYDQAIQTLKQFLNIEPDSVTRNMSYLMQISPNQWGWTPAQFKKSCVEWLLLYGNSYQWRPPVSPAEVFILPANKTCPVFDLGGNATPHPQTSDWATVCAWSR